MARYFRRGTTKIYFVKGEGVIVNVAAPDLSTELITANLTDLTCGIAEISGFSFQNNPIDTPDMCAEFVSKIPGEDTADDSSMTFYDDDTSNPIWDGLIKGTRGYVVFFPYGTGGVGGAIAAGDDCEVWPVSVASVAREWSAGNDPARFMTTFTITAPPSQNATVVA